MHFSLVGSNQEKAFPNLKESLSNIWKHQERRYTPLMYLPLMQIIADLAASWTTAFSILYLVKLRIYVSPPVFKEESFWLLIHIPHHRSNFYCNEISFYCKWMSSRPQSLRERNKHSRDWVCKASASWCWLQYASRNLICYCFYFNYLVFTSALVTVVHRF